MDREKMRAETAEKKLVVEIKREAKKGGSQAMLQMMAKDLVRQRGSIHKFVMMKIQLQGISMKLNEMKTNDQMARAMAGATKAMGRMNKQMNLPNMQKIMMEFEKQSEMMEMKAEMMDDVMEDTLGDADDEEATDEIVNKVLDELGLSLEEQLVSAPTSSIASSAPSKVAASEAMGGSGPATGTGKDSSVPSGGAGAGVGNMDDLESRLAALKKK
ncbi:hypothetical protein SARC_11033 [Sphaeroforma arctica JP610]|uniref:Charged multivesicular body protein 2a n=1 Tax=Sphaeroforma arctica JP610 TaxID=667725 RepID=A0A0L0FI83_9EUKA|nr:hypothetical protein SARC_11033 [Sphaeroforma arctica JP610]KNC76465.1 hypothetical protein SARC_11033 [Sphaeroforma arctica JP610]|eukprot:XP_014150367.1 hypothetical protein SARC_11033 [Sphaeroforma arctica JP610]